jgi:hypothetical protein
MTKGGLIVKERLLIISLFLVCALGLFAQNEPHAGSIGVLASVGYDSTMLGASINLTDNIVLRPSIGYTYEGDVPEETDTDSYTDSYYFFSLTALYQFKLAPNLVLGVGPYLGLTLESNVYNLIDSYTRDTETYTIRAGAALSAEYYLFKNLALVISATAVYSYTGGSATTTTTAGDTSTDPQQITHTFSVTTPSLGLIFMLN